MFSLTHKKAVVNSEEKVPLLSDVETQDQSLSKKKITHKKNIIKEINRCIELLENSKSDAEKRHNTKNLLLLLGILFSVGGVAVSLYYLIPEWIVENKVNFFGLTEWSGTNKDGFTWVCGYYDDQGALIQSYHPVCNRSFTPLEECKAGFERLCQYTAALNAWRNDHPGWWMGYPGFITSTITGFATSIKSYFFNRKAPPEEVAKLMQGKNLEKLSEMIKTIELSSIDLNTEKIKNLIDHLIQARDKKLININRMHVFLLGAKDPKSNVFLFFDAQGGRKSDICGIIFDFLCLEENQAVNQSIKQLSSV